MKQLLSILLALCMILSLLTVGVFAEPQRDAPEDGYYLIGTHNHWAAAELSEADRFHPSLGDASEFILETNLTQGQAFKVVRLENGAIATWYPDGPDNNYVVDADHAGPAVIYFRNTYHSDWAANGGHVWVGGKPAVQYVDENGETQSCTNYTTANFAGDTWSGWVVVTENSYLNGRVFCNGDVNLILEDGKTAAMRFGVDVPEGSSITIYGQAEGSGTLDARINNEDWELFDLMNLWPLAGIGSSYDNDTRIEVSSGPITINGGRVLAASWGGAAIGTCYGNVPTGDIVINGGYIEAVGDDFTGSGIGTGWGDNNFCNPGTVTINGGEIHAEGLTGIGDCCGGATLVTINGGLIQASEIGAGHDENYGLPVVINGGVVNVTGTIGGNPGILSERSTVTINGGQVTAGRLGGGERCDVILGWTENSDFIQSTSYAGSVSLADDWTVADSDEAFAAGAVEDAAVLAGKKLIPPMAEPAEPILDPSLRLFYSVSTQIEIRTQYSVLQNDVQSFDSWYVEISKLDADGNPTETKRFGEGQEGAVEAASAYAWSIGYTDITAKDMGVPYRATLHAFEANGQEHYSESVTKTIREVLLEVMQDDNSSRQRRTLAADMLNYGAAAQVYFDFDTGNLVNENLSAAEQEALDHYASTGEAPANLNNTSSMNVFCSTSIRNRIILHVALLGPTEENVKVRLKELDGNAEFLVDAEKQGQEYAASYSGLTARDMRKAYEVSAMVDGEAWGQSAIWSVEGHIKAARENPRTSQEELALMNALLHYVDSVAAAN